MKKILIGFLLLISYFSFGQKVNSDTWTQNEITQYAKLNELANYVNKKEKKKFQKTHYSKNTSILIMC